jgi:hypothetical protein
MNQFSLSSVPYGVANDGTQNCLDLFVLLEARRDSRATDPRDKFFLLSDYLPKREPDFYMRTMACL